MILWITSSILFLLLKCTFLALLTDNFGAKNGRVEKISESLRNTYHRDYLFCYNMLDKDG